MIFVKKKSPNDDLLGSSSSAGLGDLHGDKVNTNSSLNGKYLSGPNQVWPNIKIGPFFVLKC